MIIHSKSTNLHKKYPALSPVIMRAWLIVLLQFCFFATQAQVTTAPSDTTKKKEQATVADSAAPVPPKKWNHYSNKFFTADLGFAFIVDYNIVQQNDANVEQVGEIKPDYQLRADRLILAGTLNLSKRPWTYFVSVNYNGLDAETESFSFLDFALDIPIGKKEAWLKIGKQKEGVGYEYVLLGTKMVFMERGSGTPALVRQRNYGIRYLNNVMDKRMTYTVGLFNNSLDRNNDLSFKENGMQVTSRVTGLISYKSDRSLVHAGIGYRYADAPAGIHRYKAKPEVNTAPNFIDTDSIPATAANTVMLEGLVVNGPVSLLAEYMQAFVNSNTYGDPSFNYWQMVGSWFITGENRVYNKKTGSSPMWFPKEISILKRIEGPARLNWPQDTPTQTLQIMGSTAENWGAFLQHLPGIPMRIFVLK